MFCLKTEVLVPSEREEVFSHFERFEGFGGWEGSRLSVQVLTPSPRIRQGNVADRRVRFLGAELYWTTIVNDHKSPHCFTVIQIRGPFRFWHHEYLFEALPGGTRIAEEIRYIPPWGPLGWIADRLWIRPVIHQMWRARHKRIIGLFGQMNDAKRG